MTRSKIVDADSRRASARRARFEAREILWRESSLKRLRYCGRYAAGDTVSLMAGGEAGAGFSGVQSCGSVWSCAVCAEKVNAARRNELQAGVEAWIAAGHAVAFGTLTLSHHMGDRLADLWDAIGPAWNRTTSGSGQWRGTKGDAGDRARFGVEGYVRVVEVKHGVNGWHPHVHFLLFLDRELSERELSDLAARMFGRWEAALADSGIRTSWKHGIDLRPVGDGAGVADYLSKNSYRVSAGAAAYEVTGSHSKTAGKGGRTPFEILADVVRLGEADDLDRWHEWERASKGRRQLTWARGLRARLLDLGAELDGRDDQQIAEDSADGEAMLEVTRDGYRALAASGRLLDVLEAAERGCAAVSTVLVGIGVHFYLPGTYDGLAA